MIVSDEPQRDSAMHVHVSIALACNSQRQHQVPNKNHDFHRKTNQPSSHTLSHLLQWLLPAGRQDSPARVTQGQYQTVNNQPAAQVQAQAPDTVQTGQCLLSPCLHNVISAPLSPTPAPAFRLEMLLLPVALGDTASPSSCCSSVTSVS